MRATKTAMAAIVLALGIAIWLAVSAPEKPRAPEPGVTLIDVADAPERFADRKVTLTGRYRGTARFPPAAASAAFVLASGDDELLVTPPGRPGAAPGE